MKDGPNPEQPGLALKIGVAGLIGIGAVVSGLLVSRGGRRLVREAWQGRRRTRLEDRMLDVLWSDPVVGRRNFDVEEVEPGLLELSGVVHGPRERARALRLAHSIKGVEDIRDRLITERRSDHREFGDRARLYVERRRRRRGRHAAGA